MAKIGQIYLQNGRWKNDQLVSSSWIKTSSQDHTGTGYGYYLWVNNKQGHFSARGVRGQRIMVYPPLNLVVVITADLPPKKANTIINSIINRYILAAINNDGTI
jgi:CubicO group peptidase (beta-lactamase class C family)